MMFISRIFIALMVIGVWTTSANAGINWDRLAHAIHLTSDQLHLLQEAEATMIDEIHRLEGSFQAHEIDRQQAAGQVRSAREIFESAWQDVVTEEQKILWRQLHQDAPVRDEPVTDRAPRDRLDQDRVTDAPVSDRAPHDELDQDRVDLPVTDRAPADQLEHNRATDELPLWRRIGQLVDLTEDQIYEIQAASEVAHTSIREVHVAFQHHEIGEEDARYLIETARTQLDESVQSILTDRQLGRLRQVRDRLQHGVGHRDRVPLWGRIGRVVDLTSDQVRLLEEAEAQFLHSMLRIRNALQDGGLGRDDAGELLEGSRHRFDAAVGSILTEAQIERAREARVYDGALASETNGTVLFSLSSDLDAATAVTEQSWGQIKSGSAR